MNTMFQGYESFGVIMFNQPIGNWDVSKVFGMGLMFKILNLTRIFQIGMYLMLIIWRLCLQTIKYLIKI